MISLEFYLGNLATVHLDNKVSWPQKSDQFCFLLFLFSYINILHQQRNQVYLGFAFSFQSIIY